MAGIAPAPIPSMIAMDTEYLNRSQCIDLCNRPLCIPEELTTTLPHSTLPGHAHWRSGVFTTLEEGDFVPYTPAPHIAAIFSLCYGLIILLALIGNILVIILLVQQGWLRAVTDLFLFSLAVSDLLIVTVNMPLQLFTILHPKWTLGLIACKFKDYFQAVTILSSVLTLLVIALDRYLTICHPLRMRTVHTTCYAATVLAVMWMTAMLVSMPHILIAMLDTSKLVRNSKGEVVAMGAVCLEDFTGAGMNKHIFNILTYMGYFVIPVVLIVAAYGAVARVLWKRSAVGDSTQRQTEVCMKQKRRLVRMLVTVVAVFVICWFPFFTATFIRSFNKDAQRVIARHRIHEALQMIGYANSFTNPIIFTFMSPRIRKNLLVLFRKKCSWRCAKSMDMASQSVSTVVNGRIHMSQGCDLRMPRANQTAPTDLGLFRTETVVR